MKIRICMLIAVFLLTCNLFSHAQLEYNTPNQNQYFSLNQSMQEYVITNSAGKVLENSEFGGWLQTSEGLTVVYLKYEECEWGDAFTDYGFVNDKNVVVIPLKFSYAENFIKGSALVKIKEKFSLIDKTGKELLTLNADEAFSLGNLYIVIKLKTQYSLVDRNGNFVRTLKYDKVGYPAYNLARVEYQNKLGFIDAQGKEIIPLIYHYAEKFNEGAALVSTSTYGATGFIDTKGKVVVPLKYDFASSFSDGLAAVELDELWGYVDITGKVVIPLKYDLAGDFNKGVTWVESGGENFKINKKGERVD